MMKLPGPSMGTPGGMFGSPELPAARAVAGLLAAGVVVVVACVLDVAEAAVLGRSLRFETAAEASVRPLDVLILLYVE